MGQKNVSQGDGYGNDTNNPERSADDGGGGGLAQTALENVDVGESDDDVENLEDLGVSERFQDALNEVEMHGEMDEKDAAQMKKSLGKLATPGDQGMTTAQYDRLSMQELQDEDLATDVMARTWGDEEGTPIAGTEQRLGVQEDITETQADVGAVHAMTLANGMDTGSHTAGEQARSAFENGDMEQVFDVSSDEQANRRLVTQNDNMSTEWAEDFKDSSNDLYDHYVETAEQDSSGEWNVEHEFDGGRDDSMRAGANGREAAVLVGTSLMKDKSTMGTNAFVHHGETLKSGVEAVGSEAVGQEQKELINYMHDRAQMVDDVESPWDDTPFDDVEYDYSEVATRTLKQRFKGAGVDTQRFFPSSDTDEKPELPDNNNEVSS